jgi:chromosome segregation ATPase
METTEKQRIEQIIKGFGFASSDDWMQKQLLLAASKKNGIVTHSHNWHEVKKTLDSASTALLIRELLLYYVENELQHYKNQIDSFEQKYQMTWKEFTENFNNLEQFDWLKMEMDEMEWEADMDSFNYFTSILAELQNA